jgi:hypothetical protein
MLDGLLVRVILRTSLVCIASAMPAAAQTIAVRVPFVGCKSDGQMGPVQAPAIENKVVLITAEMAGRLAYYKAEEGSGVLAPRGWYCFGTYGSNGEVLYVSPNPIGAADVLSTTKWKGFTGPAIEASFRYGDTSGRFDVARMIARVFPDYRKFLQKVIDEGIEPASSFPSGPYPKDKLTYRSRELVEYQTPPEAEGLGTRSWLLKNGDPIHGLATLVGETPDLMYLAVRVPPEMGELVPVIVQQAERDAAKSAEK